jgi:hypothetical protein
MIGTNINAHNPKPILPNTYPASFLILDDLSKFFLNKVIRIIPIINRLINPVINDINLVTKNNYWEKPTYETLRQALEDARNIINLFETRIKKIVMPRIGCGLDKLDWNKVKPMVEEILADFEVVVCYI